MKLTARISILAWTGLTTSLWGAPATSPLPSGVPSLPDSSFSVIRVLGALTLVLGLFLGAAWLFRNWQRFVLKRTHAPNLQLLEMKPLGNRHVLYVVGYQQQRLLLSASPTGVTLLSHLPSEEATGAPPAVAAHPPFIDTLQQMLQRKA